ncbi:uncharacterized protein BDV14DRAFT_198371 [Aspergillus stella-maris]|uniref:uncharacterized protein n=1 Tax=Aspergillus stella-maris TaxID=1810926 RepID=UPI003CCE135D
MSFRFRISVTTLPLIQFLLLLLLLPQSLLATNYPPCIQSCITANPSNSWCSGNETGRAQEECLCRGLQGQPIIECIRNCTPSEQWDYAGDISDTCRERLFPEAREDDDDDADSERSDEEGIAQALDVNVMVVGLVAGLSIMGTLS